MLLDQAIFRRSELLLGDEAMSRIGEKRVIIFGVGGVGSWCAESLVRSGIKHLTIVDSDRVCITNINRQRNFYHQRRRARYRQPAAAFSRHLLQGIQPGRFCQCQKQGCRQEIILVHAYSEPRHLA